MPNALFLKVGNSNLINVKFSTWKKRNLTPLGKISVIKSLILPIFTIVGTPGVVPEIYLKEIEKQCYRFIVRPDKVN